VVLLQARQNKIMDVKEKAWHGRMAGMEQKETRMSKKNVQRGELPPITLDGENSMVSVHALLSFCC
jgi:hypothetical protein